MSARKTMGGGSTIEDKMGKFSFSTILLCLRHAWQKGGALFQPAFLQSRSSCIHKLMLSFTPHMTFGLVDSFQTDLMGHKKKGCKGLQA